MDLQVQSRKAALDVVKKNCLVVYVLMSMVLLLWHV